MDLTAAEQPGVHRIDVRELNTVAAGAGAPADPVGVPLSARRRDRTPPALRSASSDSPMPASSPPRPIAPTATTLVTSEGRALTEVRLDDAQSIAAVPQGRTAARRDDRVGRSRRPQRQAGERRRRHAHSVDARRPRPSRPYTVSFVYVHAGTPFLKKGDIEMALPKMDVPIGVVEWEVFVPEQYQRARDRRQHDRREALRGRFRARRIE